MIRWRARVLTPLSPSAVHWQPDALVEVEGGRFARVAAYRGEPVHEDLRDGVLLPGFVDTHVHFAQTHIVGSASGPLLQWLAESVFPEEARLADEAYARRVARACCRRLAASGTTLAVLWGSVHGRAADVLLEEMAQAGLQGVVGPVWMDEDCPAPLRREASATIDALDALRERWHGHDEGRLEVAVLPRFALSCSRSSMRRAADYATRHGLLVSTHLSEHPAEAQAVAERFGVPDYLTVYEEVGLLATQPGPLFAHCIHLDDAAWDRLARAGARVAHCPDSNAFLGSGGMPVGAPLARALPLGVGTDVGAGRSFLVPRTLSAAYDNGLRQGVPLALAQLLWWGTRGGAEALGRPDTGRVAPGDWADACLFVPRSEVPSTPDALLGALFFDHDRSGIASTWVRGRRVRPPQ